ncbi:MAG: tetratricopeptide repeat protein [gamma proteobacterium symbiont of Clathrolucina costata]|uniref:Tetratricopeptide repeat protein n=1 Tax=Candidatus Thiodiazotropha taylori TaxID=2792791 RepID=A0A9E4TRT0_9GAMM|nr:tetratricopeptide repeat protein [Candidatus Thiodiazotropha taylori]MCW4235142.1 tetratricopeptide repeat protein [Candidatus Thiodiazotropha endolucinida]
MSVELERAHKLENFLTQDPSNTHLLHDIATTYQAAGEYGKSIEYFERLRDLTGDDPGLLNSLGALYLSLDRGDEALNVLQSATALAPNESNLLFNLGYAHFSLEQTETARDIFKKLADQHPDDPQYPYYLALTHDELGDTEASINYLDKVLSLDENHLGGQFFSALNDFQSGNLNKAQERTELILKRHPNNIDTLHLKAEIAMLDFDPKLALTTLRKAESIEPNQPRTHLLLGQALLILQRIKQARLAFERATDLDTTSAYAYIGLGWTALLQKDYTLAEEAFSQAIINDPGEADGYVGMAALALLLESPNEAKQQLRKALQINPENVIALLIQESIDSANNGDQITDATIRELLTNRRISPFGWSMKDIKTKFEASPAGHTVINKQLRLARMKKLHR